MAGDPAGDEVVTLKVAAGEHGAARLGQQIVLQGIERAEELLVLPLLARGRRQSSELAAGLVGGIAGVAPATLVHGEYHVIDAEVAIQLTQAAEHHLEGQPGFGVRVGHGYAMPHPVEEIGKIDRGEAHLIRDRRC